MKECQIIYIHEQTLFQGSSTVCTIQGYCEEMVYILQQVIFKDFTLAVLNLS